MEAHRGRKLRGGEDSDMEVDGLGRVLSEEGFQ